MKTQNKILGLMSAIILAFAILPMASAAIAQIAPTVGSNQSANFLVNFTFVNITDGVNDPTSLNSTFYWNATGVWVQVTKSGFTCNGVNCIATLATSSMAEGRGKLNFSAGNDTVILEGTTGGIFTLDKTNPSGSITVIEPNVYQYSPMHISWSATDSGSGLNTTNVTITSPDSIKCPPITFSTSSGSTTLTGMQTACVGNYNASIVTTDYSSNVGSSSVIVAVQDAGGTIGGGGGPAGNTPPGGGFAPTELNHQTNNNNTLIAVVVIAVILILVFNGRKR